MIYRGQKKNAISFPLGGIGTGSVGLSGDGRLIDWEIFNRPNKYGRNGFTHFAIKAEQDGKLLDARILAGELAKPWIGELPTTFHKGFGYGPDRETMAGFPNFRHSEFHGAFPLAEVRLKDPSFPGEVSLHAWNPFIPLNENDSSIPAAFFEVALKNPTRKNITYTAAFSLANHQADGQCVHTHQKNQTGHFIHLKGTSRPPNSTEYGDLTLATDATDVSYQEYWYRGGWFDSVSIFWRDFAAVGTLKNRRYAEVSRPGNQDTAVLSARLTAKPGETVRAKFVLSWNRPNCHAYWIPEPGPSWKNWYATRWPDSLASAEYALENWERLSRETRAFHQALFSSKVPESVLDAVSANLAILKSPTVLRLENGEFYAWEGVSGLAGSCEGSCTHVWNYAYALPFLFPKLERSMRDLNYRYNLRENGGMNFRLRIPLGRERGDFRPCADGQFGDVIKTYRDWKLSGDTLWLKSLWPAVKRSIEFAWDPSNQDGWDADRDGVLEGRQHHTLDMELFGPNSWLTGFYLAALKAGAEMADAVNEPETEKSYMDLFKRGKTWVDANLFNGEFYFHKIDLGDKKLLEKNGGSTFEHDYWNDEHQEIKYQIGEGSSIDQVVAQWHANLAGLGEIFESSQVKKALAAIYRHNYKKSFRDFVNPCRLYSLYDEKGVVICSWPEGRREPVIPAPYSQETMYGFEYAVAAHMCQEGLVKEGLEIVQSVQEKFDGENRNPWNEFECGSNYARSMASYALLSALGGFEYDLRRGHLGFDPKPGVKKIFWCVDGAWGTASFSAGKLLLEVVYGKLSLHSLRLPGKKNPRSGSAKKGTVTLSGSIDGKNFVFSENANLAKGDTVRVKFR